MILFSYILALLLSGPGDPKVSSVTCFFEVDGSYLNPTSPLCPDISTGSIVFNVGGLSGGMAPYIYDWDNLGTSGNDVYNDDGETTIDSIPAGMYQLIVTDDAGCIASASVTVTGPAPFVVTTQIDPIVGCEATGGIYINTFSGPAGIVIYNWDLASTTFDDDFGMGAVNYGLPPAEDDAQDLVTNALDGTYYLEISVSDNPNNPTNECFYRDTFIIVGENVMEICPLGDITYYAGTSNPALTYQWQVDSVSGFLNLSNGLHYSGATTPNLMILDAPSSWYGYKYRAKMMQGAVTTYSQVFTLRFVVCWNGAVDMAWENPNNWSCSIIPTVQTDVFIPSGLPRYPKVNSNRLCRSIKLASGATLDVKVPWRLQLLGDQ